MQCTNTEILFEYNTTIVYTPEYNHRYKPRFGGLALDFIWKWTLLFDYGFCLYYRLILLQIVLQKQFFSLGICGGYNVRLNGSSMQFWVLTKLIILWGQKCGPMDLQLLLYKSGVDSVCTVLNSVKIILSLRCTASDLARSMGYIICPSHNIVSLQWYWSHSLHEK